MQITIDREKGFAEITIEGSPELETLKDMTDALLSHPDYVPGMKALYDYRPAQLGHWNLDKLLDAANYLSRKQDTYPKKIALVADQDLEYGILRQWEARVENIGPGRRGLFRDYDKALQWLLDDENDVSSTG